MTYVIEHTSENADIVYNVCKDYGLLLDKQIYFEVDGKDYHEFCFKDDHTMFTTQPLEKRLEIAHNAIKDILVDGL